MKREIDICSWNRKEHYEFFKSFDEPFFGLVSNMDCTKALRACKQEGQSFFLWYMYHSLAAVNKIEEFRYRIENDKVVCYDKIHGGSTIGRDDHTFAFAFLPYAETYSTFQSTAQKEIDRVKEATGLCFDDNAKRNDLIHYSSIPWVSFTGLSHARSFGFNDSVPKISFGKYFKEDSRILLPVSVHVHHALMDGFHVGRYLEEFQNGLNEDTFS